MKAFGNAFGQIDKEPHAKSKTGKRKNDKERMTDEYHVEQLEISKLRYHPPSK